MLQLYNGAKEIIHNNQDQPMYEFQTWYLKASNGQTCKATQIVNNGGPKATRDAKGVQAALGANFQPYNVRFTTLATELTREIKRMQELNAMVNSLRIEQASASLALTALGLGAIKYGKELKKCNKIINQCNAVIDTYLHHKQAHFAAIRWILDNAVDIDGKQSTDYTVFTPTAPGEVPPSDTELQLVETFKVK